MIIYGKRRNTVVSSQKLYGLYSLMITCALFALLGIPARSQVSPQQSVIKLSVIVTDGSKRPVRGLQQSDFRVLEEGEIQSPSFFSNEETPIICGLVLDNTGSMKGKLDGVNEAARMIINGKLPGDEFFLTSVIDGAARIVVDWTPDQVSLLETLDQLVLARGQVSIIDSISACAEHFANYRKRGSPFRRHMALLVLTDGIERDSSFRVNDLVRHVRNQGVQVFAIGFVKGLEGKSSYNTRVKAMQWLEKLASETGGMALFPDSMAGLRGATNEIMDYLRSQYIIEYSSATKRGHSNPNVQVQLAVSPDRGKYKVKVRPSYPHKNRP